MVEELYDAPIEAGASEEKARAASRAVADMERHFTNIEKEIFGLRSHLDQQILNLRAEITGLRAYVDRQITGLRAYVDEHIAGRSSDLSQERRPDGRAIRRKQSCSPGRSYLAH